MELIKIFIENVSIKDLIITLLLIGFIGLGDVVLFTHPKTRDLFTEEKEEKGE